jgi:hypothetical protein
MLDNTQKREEKQKFTLFTRSKPHHQVIATTSMLSMAAVREMYRTFLFFFPPAQSTN